MYLHLVLHPFLVQLTVRYFDPMGYQIVVCSHCQQLISQLVSQLVLVLWDSVFLSEMIKLHKNQEILLEWINKGSKSFDLRIHELKDDLGEKNLISSTVLTPRVSGEQQESWEVIFDPQRRTCSDVTSEQGRG